MATRARIGIDNQDGTVTSIYLHHDGYTDGAGRILAADYTTPERVEALLELGDLSSLGGTSEDTIAYGRDRGEDGCEAATHGYEDWPASGAAFQYLYDLEAGWLVRTPATEGPEDGAA